MLKGGGLNSGTDQDIFKVVIIAMTHLKANTVGDRQHLPPPPLESFHFQLSPHAGARLGTLSKHWSSWEKGLRE